VDCDVRLLVVAQQLGRLLVAREREQDGGLIERLRQLHGGDVHHIVAVEIRIERQVRSIGDLGDERTRRGDRSQAVLVARSRARRPADLGQRVLERLRGRCGLHGQAPALLGLRVVGNWLGRRATDRGLHDAVQHRPHRAQISDAVALLLAERDVLQALLQEQADQQSDRQYEKSDDDEQLLTNGKSGKRHRNVLGGEATGAAIAAEDHSSALRLRKGTNSGATGASCHRGSSTQ